MSRQLWLLSLLALACGPGINNGKPASPTFAVSLAQPSATFYASKSVDVLVNVTGQPDKVDLMLDGAVLVTLPSSYRYHWDVSAMGEASHVLTARLTAGATQLTSTPQTVVIDHTVPTVVSRSPTATTPIGLDGAIQAVFSEPLGLASVVDANVQLTADGLGPLAKKLTVSADGLTLTVTPTQRFALPAKLSVQLTQALTDRAGNSLAETGWSWNVRAWTQLDVSGWTPPRSDVANLSVLPDGRLAAAIGANGYVENESSWSSFTSGPNDQMLAGAFNSMGALYEVAHTSTSACVYWELFLYRTDAAAPTKPVTVGPGYFDVSQDFNFCGPFETSLAFTSKGVPFVGLIYRHLPMATFGMYSTMDVGLLSGPTFNVPGSDGGTSSPAIAVDDWDEPIAEWIQNGHAWVQRHQDATPVDLQGFIPDASPARSTALVRDPAGPVYAAVGTATGIAVLRNTGSGWSELGGILPSPGGAVLRMALSLDAKGSPVIAWIAGDSYTDQGMLSVSHWIGGKWEVIPLPKPSSGFAQRASVFAIAGNWRGHIVVYGVVAPASLFPTDPALWRSEESF